MRVREWFGIAVIIFLILLIAFPQLYKGETKTTPAPQKEAPIIEQPAPIIEKPITVAPDPCSQISLLRAELAARQAATTQAAKAEADAQNAYNRAKKDCLGEDKEESIKSSSNRNRPPNKSEGKKAATVEPTEKEFTQAAEQYVSSSRSLGPTHDVSTSVSDGDIKMVTFCVNIHGTDPSSFWPHISIHSGGSVEGAVLNGDGTGYNVKIYPVETISGLYGVTFDKEIFVQCDLLTAWSPTDIRIGSDYHWAQPWKSSQVQNIDGIAYYVVQF